MANAVFPATLTRRQYLIRCLFVFVGVLGVLAVILAEPILFGDAPTDTNLVHIFAKLIETVFVLAFLYNIFGLSIPRLKNAQISPWMVLLAVIPVFGVLVLFAICAIAREKA